MKITQSWKRNMPTADGHYGLTVTFVYSSNCQEEIDRVEKRLPEGVIIIDTDEPRRMLPLERARYRAERLLATTELRDLLKETRAWEYVKTEE